MIPSTVTPRLRHVAGPELASGRPRGRGSTAQAPRRLPLRWLVGCAVLCLAPTDSVASPEERVVDLPPLVVEGTASPLRWRHAALPGKEVLSACSDSVTQDFVIRLQRQTELLAWLLPPPYQASSVVPDTYLLLSPRTPRATSTEIMKDLLQRPAGEGAGRASAAHAATDRVRFLPNLRMLDVDATIVFVLLDDEDEAGGFSFTIDRVRQLLVQRRPRLPPWLVHGLLQLYPELSFENEELRAGPARWPTLTAPSGATGGGAPQPLAPMAELLASPSSATPSVPALAPAIRDAQSALFLRWALIDGSAARRAAFWRLVDRLESEPATDALLRTELGVDFAALDQNLRDYLPHARNEKRRIHAATPGRIARPALRDATPAEIARIRGDWERLSISYVRQRLPELVPKYAERARRTARAGYEQGSRDPSLLAVIGLIEIDAGRPAEARPWLEQAAALGAARPRALLELALLRFAESGLANPAPAVSPTAEQVAAVLTPLESAAALRPALPPVYALQAEVWMRAGTRLSTDQLTHLRRAVTLFPESSLLAVRTAQLLALYGEPEAAREVIRRARAASEQPAALRWFDAVEASLAAEGATATPGQEPQLQRSGSQR